MAEIKIPTHNFMGVNEKPREKKPPVRTVDGDLEEIVCKAALQNRPGVDVLGIFFIQPVKLNLGTWV